MRRKGEGEGDGDGKSKDESEKAQGERTLLASLLALTPPKLTHTKEVLSGL